MGQRQRQCMSDAPFKCYTLGRLIFTCAAQRRDLMRIVHGTLSSDNAYDNEPDPEPQTIDIDARYATCDLVTIYCLLRCLLVNMLKSQEKLIEATI